MKTTLTTLLIGLCLSCSFGQPPTLPNPPTKAELQARRSWMLAAMQKQKLSRLNLSPKASSQALSLGTPMSTATLASPSVVPSQPVNQLTITFTASKKSTLVDSNLLWSAPTLTGLWTKTGLGVPADGSNHWFKVPISNNVPARFYKVLEQWNTNVVGAPGSLPVTVQP